MQNLIPIILVAVAVATALNVCLRRFGMPTVVGYIITGALIDSFMHFDTHADASWRPLKTWVLVLTGVFATFISLLERVLLAVNRPLK